MPVSIDENILLGAGVAVFIPIFVFFIKLIIEIGNIKGRIETMCNNIEEHKKSLTDVNSIKTDLKLIDLRLDNIEEENKTKKGAPMDHDRNSSHNSNNNYNDRKGGYQR